MEALRRICSVKDVSLWLCEKQHLAPCSNFIGCLSGSGKPRARAVILGSEGEKSRERCWDPQNCTQDKLGRETFCGYS